MCAVVACLLKWQSTTGTACAGFKGTLFENGGSNNVCRKPKHSLRLFSEYSCLFWVPGQKPYPWKQILTSIFFSLSSNVRVLTHLPKPCTTNVSERKLRNKRRSQCLCGRCHCCFQASCVIIHKGAFIHCFVLFTAHIRTSGQFVRCTTTEGALSPLHFVVMFAFLTSPNLIFYLNCLEIIIDVIGQQVFFSEYWFAVPG